MRKAIPFLATVLCGLLASSGAHAAKGKSSTPTSSGAKQTYKWVDEKGITHYGVYAEGFEEATRVELEWFDKHLKK